MGSSADTLIFEASTKYLLLITYICFTTQNFQAVFQSAIAMSAYHSYLQKAKGDLLQRDFPQCLLKVMINVKIP